MPVKGAGGVMLARRVLTVGSGAALAQGITALSTPVLTRLYAPEAHAIWAVFMSFSLLFSGIATLRYELAVVLPSERGKAAALVFAGLASALAFSAVAGTAVWFLGDSLFAGEQMPSMHAWSWLVPMTVFTAATHQLMAAWCTREAAFGMYSVGQFLLPASIVAAQMLYAAAGRTDASGLIGGTVTGQLVAAGFMAMYVGRRDLPALVASLKAGRVRPAMREYKAYPMYMTPYTLAGVARERSVYFLLGRFGAPEAAGHYSLVARITNLPTTFVASAVRPVFFQHAVGLAARELEMPVRETMRFLGCAAALFWAPCVVHAPWLMGLVFGAAWRDASTFVIILSVPAIPLLMGNWADRMFDVLGRQRLAFGLELAFAILSILTLLAGYWWWGDLLHAVMLQCAALTAYYVTWLVVLFRAAGYEVRRLVWVFGEVVLVGALSLALCLGLEVVMPGPVAFLAGFSLALAAALLLGRKGWVKIRNSLGSTEAALDNTGDSVCRGPAGRNPES